MKWIKASERLPKKTADRLEDDKGIIFRNIRLGITQTVYLSITASIRGMIPIINDYEWLDETESPYSDGWIGVEDGLPEFTKNYAGNKATELVLVFIDGEIHEAYLEAVRPTFEKLIWSPEIGDDCMNIEEYFGKKVTHWRKLPLPPNK